MIWAIKKNERTKSVPFDRAKCPLCNKEVIAKCGEIKIWHWAHKSNFECDSFGESESDWHIKWKENFPKEHQEVLIQKNKGLEIHRADIKTKSGTIIELQNSPISSKQIKKREEFYGEKMIWILNGKTFGKNIIFYKQRFKWKWFPKSWEVSERRIYIDLGKIYLMYLNIVGPTGMFIKFSKIAFIIEHGGNPFK